MVTPGWWRSDIDYIFVSLVFSVVETMLEKVAVVTGSSKGIGYAIVKGLCEKFKGITYLTAPEVSIGEAAVAKLKELGYNPRFHQLDITDQGSVDRFKDFIQSTHGGVDILINNAGIAFKNDATEPYAVQAEETVKVNYFGTLRMCEAFFPLLRQDGRVVTVSSSAGFLNRIPSENIKSKLKNPNLTVEDVTELMRKFVADAKAGTAEQEGWGESCYGVSKVGLSALSIVQQKNFDKEIPNRNIAINYVHPGYVATDMSSHKGPLTIEEGAKSALFCALEADFKGKYVWFDCQVVDWYGENTPSQV